MGGIVQIVLGQPAKTNYQPQVYFIPPVNNMGFQPPTQYISWITISISDVLEPGYYNIPEDQRTDLTWFNDNNFRTDKFCRRHLGYVMEDNEPTQVLITG